MLEDETSFLTCLGDTIRLRIVPGGTPLLSHEQRVRGQVAARELRQGASWGSAPVLQAIQRLQSALGRLDPIRFFPALDASVELEPVIAQTLDEHILERLPFA